MRSWLRALKLEIVAAEGTRRLLGLRRAFNGRLRGGAPRAGLLATVESYPRPGQGAEVTAKQLSEDARAAWALWWGHRAALWPQRDAPQDEAALLAAQRGTWVVFRDGGTGQLAGALLVDWEPGAAGRGGWWLYNLVAAEKGRGYGRRMLVWLSNWLKPRRGAEQPTLHYKVVNSRVADYYARLAGTPARPGTVPGLRMEDRTDYRAP